MTAERVFIPDESGEGGDEVELGRATFDMDIHQWVVWETKFKARLATDDEINAARGLRRSMPLVWEGDDA